MTQADDATRRLFMGFESLGGLWEGCEFGIAQRHYGAEPLGLLRWATMTPEGLIDALRNRFAGVGTPEQTIITIDDSGEYMTIDKKYFMRCHTFVKASEMPEDRMKSISLSRLVRLKDKIIEDLLMDEKVFVYKMSTRTIYDDELFDLLGAIRQYSSATLLYVRLEDPAHPFPTVEWRAPGLLVGYIDRFSQNPDNSASHGPDGVPSRPHASWAKLCRAADIVRRSNPAAALMAPRTPEIPSWQSYVEAARQTGKDVPGTILVHIGNIGDVTNKLALIGGDRGWGRHIQGFAIDVPLPAGNVEYRALFPDGTWSDWVDGGIYAGTRGQSLPLHGFAARLVGRAEEDFDCRYAGAFLGDPVVVEAGNGQPCQSASGGPLAAMAVLLRRRSVGAQASACLSWAPADERAPST